MAEIYPAALFGELPYGPRSKADRDERRCAVDALAAEPDVRLRDPDAAWATEDDFDAAVTAFFLLRRILQGRALFDPALVDAEAEGAILGVSR